jgi:exosortase
LNKNGFLLPNKQPRMISAEKPSNGVDAFRREAAECWRAMPDKGLFFALLVLWLALFHVLGNSTFGYKGTGSLFNWLYGMYRDMEDNEHGMLIPWIVLGLFWWKRQEWLAIPKAPWWPAFGLLAVALMLHVFGFVAQQARISTVGLFLGLYALLGLVWGLRMMRVSFFPFFPFAFCLPLSGGPSDAITLPLRFLATRITCLFTNVVLGINVIQDGTRVFNSTGSYQYEIAAACSGMRSLTATLAIAVIYAFVMLKSPWRRALMVVSAIPLAVAANVFRLSTIIVASEAFGGQQAGNYVHASSWMSLLPYIPAIGGVLLLGHWLREDKPGKGRPGEPQVLPGVVNCL